jgi:two-component system C4-dicarboxylate transport sensor histidine kinase DctB
MNGDQPVQETGRLAELGMLTAELIHELRNPLFALKSLAQLMMHSPERGAALLPMVMEQVVTMEQLLHGYGNMGKKPDTKAEHLDVSEPVRAAMVILERRAQVASVKLELVLPMLPLAWAGRLALQQALVNLGQNAIDAVTGRSGGSVWLKGWQEEGHLCLQVLDNGPGLPEAIRANLFMPFHTTKPHGTGLGLMLSREILAGCGAELLLVEVEQGTCWQIRLPIVAPPG